MRKEMSESFYSTANPLRVLFLCTHNSSRSQMAEGLLQARGGSAYAVFSAGTEPRNVHPMAIKVMQKVGIDISAHQAKSLELFYHQPRMDLVITVCDEAAEACPFFSNTQRQVHWGYPDPSQFQGSEEEQLDVFRHTRDRIAARTDQFLRQQSLHSLEETYQAAKDAEN
jgi:arsenate reductase (thioredoxin)